MIPNPGPQLSSDSATEAERFRFFVANVTDYAIYMLSPEGTVVTWNAGAQRFKGYTADDIIGKHFSRFYTCEDQAAGLPEQALKIAAEEGKFENEGWRVRKDGSLFWANVVIDPIRDNDGKLIGFAKITRDITERKKAAEALHASEERFRLLVQGVTDYAIYMLSPSGEITNWNAGAERIKGFSQDEVVGTHFSRFYTDEDRLQGLPMRALTTAVSEGRYENEGWRVRKDGSRFWAHAVIDPIRNDLGELIGFAKVTRDITERRNTNLALEKAQEALFHSQKMEALGKLTGGVAHDFNNLLSVIVNGIEILRREVSSDMGTKVMDSMARAVSRGESLTRQLLAFARQQPIAQEKHDLNRVINSFEAVLRRANRGTVAFDINASTTLPPVMIDVAQFEAALLNLVVNARDATPDGGRIVVAMENTLIGDGEINRLPAGRYVKVSVTDTGEGMAPEVVARAVEPFFTTKPPGRGTGLGLSQVYGFVQQARGDLVINSAPGAGTTVSLFLPALDEHGDDQHKLIEPMEKALVVDDQTDVLDMAVELFRTMGYEVMAANNGADALKILERTPGIDVLFTDLIMPGMSGIELGRKARELIPGLHILLASGYADPTLVTDNNQSKEFHFINKPYRLADVVKKLRMPG